MKRLTVTLLTLLVAAPAAHAARPGLQRFKSCDRLVAYADKHRRHYAAGGPPPQFTPAGPDPSTAAGGPRPAAAPGEAQADAGSFSLTNNQEAGVFEPDIVKTDGTVVYAVTPAGVLEVVDVTGTPQRIGSLALPEGFDHQLLLHRGRLLVAASTGDGRSSLSLVDVSDPARPALESTMTINGSVLAERRTRSTVRVVLTVTPYALAVERPMATRRARAWLPRARLGHRRRTLVACRQVRRPRSFTGLEELTVLTIDFDRGLAPVDADAVMTGGGTVYASADNLFVATNRYRPELERATDGPDPERESTQIHRFSLDDADTTTYRGSGSVPGFVLNQFSMSEQEGVLRVATTETPPWFRDSTGASQSLVTTLGATDTGLTRLGQVGGLGRGERIFAVRMFGDRGYVVTYRQVDPLYTLDLSDPADPALKGELELPGFSSYLHPVSSDRLIGVGTSADGGVQLSEFDVSDLAAPRLQQQRVVDNAFTEVAYDHHAFLWWEPRSLAVLPISVYDDGSGGPPGCNPDQPCPAFSRAPSASAFAFAVVPTAIHEAGRVTHPGHAVVRRSIVLGDRLLTVSDAGLQATALDDFGDRGFAAFG